MRGKPQLVLLGILAFACLFMPSLAHADSCSTSLCVSVWDNTANPVQYFSDTNGGADTCAASGCIQFSTSIGNWILNSGTALGAPFFSLPNLLDLNSLNVSNSGGGHLTLEPTENNISAPLGNLAVLFALGGTHSIGNATMTAQAFIGLTNVRFDTTTSLTNVLNGNGLSFNDMKSGQHSTGAGPYSLTLQFDLYDPAADHTSFDGDLNIPEPATLSVLGAALLGLGTGIRRKLTKV